MNIGPLLKFHGTRDILQVRAHLAVTQVRVPVPTQAKPPFPSVTS
jgi:hypothetical protein